MRQHLKHYGYYRGRSEDDEEEEARGVPLRGGLGGPNSGPPRSSTFPGSLAEHSREEGTRPPGRPSAGPRPPGPPPWRSTQLVLEEGAGAPRLREPLQGPAPSASALPAHAPRWPLDCQVVPERVAHIDWDPSEPEPLYEATGREHEPLCVGDESGEVVFEIEKGERVGRCTGDSVSPRVSASRRDSASPRVSLRAASSERCFVSARIGGRRGPLVPPPAATRGDDDSTLLFESRFESGNLQKAVRVGEWEYELTLRSDLYTDKHTQWFYFRVGNTRAAPRRYRFTITNLGKPRSLYGAGLRPLFYSECDAAGPLALGWRRAGSDVRYYRTRTAAAAAAETRARYSLTWTFSFPHEGDECYWAHCYPYTYSRLAARLARVAADPRAARLCRTRVLCRSLAGNPVPVLTITSPAPPPPPRLLDGPERGARDGGAAEEEEGVGGSAERGARAALLGRAKRAVVVTARVHPGESNSSWVMEGLLDFLLGDSADARLLRDTFVFKVVPMLNPDGVLVGNYRCSLSGRDLNRNYRTALREAFPPVWHLRAMVRRLLEKREVVMFCDLHGHSRRSNVFVYGCEGAAGSGHGPRGGQSGRVFPLMMSKNIPDKFSYESCRFKVQKSKEGTSRVSMWRMGIANSFTLETTFAGSTLGERKGTHFSVEDLKSVGYQLCDTLLDYCDPDQAKVELCEREVMERAQATERMRNLGKDGGGPWGLGLSDIESSESGSDSSQSDGLPSHLLALLPKMRVKRRRLKSRKERNRTRLGLLQAVGAVGALGSGFPPSAGPRRAGPRRGTTRPSGGAFAEAAAEAAGEPVGRKEADKVHTQRYRRSGPATTVMAAVGGARGGAVAATATQGPPGAQTSVPLAYVGSDPLAGVSTLARDAAASAQTQAATPTLDPGHGDFCPAHGTLATQYLSGLLEEGWGVQWEGSGLSLRHVTRHMAPSSRRRMLLGGQLVLPVSMTTALPPNPRRPPRTAIRQHPLPFDPWLEEASGFLSSGRLQRSSREPLSLLPATQRPASVRMGPLSRTPRPLGAIGSGDAGTPERGRKQQQPKEPAPGRAFAGRLSPTATREPGRGALVTVTGAPGLSAEAGQRAPRGATGAPAGDAEEPCWVGRTDGTAAEPRPHGRSS
ncbi:cytosolic carboxypeptidase 2-like isoform X1 [Lethenteron reissneri]|uniref:cytosolic carboxypeptidase 2-like isoform X1 n=2 Tax=Lethenteron reissneri TaxID=7753 RepID=UPI002AB69D50|nr:cytosolic carboxypeptidase 2-like isoform X1 [Lethenteron reissneri]